MKRKVVIAGGTGFIGQYLEAAFLKKGYEVHIISRKTGHIHWDDFAKIKTALEGSELLINLAGKSVDCRYTAKNKKAILDSRISTTNALSTFIKHCQNPPPLWINASSATYYRDARDKPMDEISGETGTGFSVNVVKAWEQSFFQDALPNTRRVALRIAIVLGKNGGVMLPFTNLVKFGLGGKQGDGKQMFSWIHIKDLCNIIAYVQEHKEMEGVYNCSAPNPVTNTTLMQMLSAKIKPLLALPSPKMLLSIGAFFIRTETELILKSRWVIPTRLCDAGFAFQYPNLQMALSEILD